MNDFIKIIRKKYMLVVAATLAVFAVVLYAAGGFESTQPVNSETEISVSNVEPPTFSIESGFYNSPFYLTINVPKDSKVYYTLDCTEPNEKSFLYTEPIYLEDASKNENVYSMRMDVSAGFYTELMEQHQTIDKDPEYVAPDFPVEKCNVVRAVAVDKNGQKSEIITKTYFVDLLIESFEGTNVVTVTTSPDNLFDHEKGIYVTGDIFDKYINGSDVAVNWRFWSANYRQKGSDWERCASVSFFDKEGNLVCEQQCGAVRIQGGVSRGTVPRSLNLYAKDANGNAAFFDCKLFSSDYTPQAITLSSGGNRLWTKFNDYMMTQRCSQLNFATMNFEPYVLFLDGEYWGFYWLAEKYDAQFIAHYYDVDVNNICMIKNGEVACGDDSAISLYSRMRHEITSRDLSQQSEYKYACSIIDINSFADYYATMAYIARQEDWPSSNFALWRTVGKGEDTFSDGKWRWMLFDCNSVSMNAEIVNDNSLEFIIDKDELFAAFWENEEFRELFKDRILYIADKCFDAEEMTVFIDDYDATMRSILSKSWTRFHGSDNNKIEDYETDMNGYRAFFEERRAVVESWFE